MSKLLDNIQERIDRLELVKEWLVDFDAALEGIEMERPPSNCGFYIDFDNLTHAAAVKVMLALGAKKWNKEANGSGQTFNYISAEPINGYPVRLWSAEPPPTCRLVTEEVEVPETVIPAHKEKRTRMVCDGGEA